MQQEKPKDIKKNHNNWVPDLAFGKEGETWFSKLGEETTVEVKRDKKWHSTRNIFFEISCSGKPSGIMSTEAHYIAYLLSKDGKQVGAYLFETIALRRAISEALNAGLGRKVRGGDGFRVEGIVFSLVEVSVLLEYMGKY